MPSQTSELAGENARLRQELSAVRQDIERGASELDKMRHARLSSEESLKQFEKRLQESRGQTDELTARLEELEAKEKQLADDNQQKDTVIADLSGKNVKLHKDNVENLSGRILLESLVRDLAASLREQTAEVERERQLMSVSKDVRQWRTLHRSRRVQLLPRRLMNLRKTALRKQSYSFGPGLGLALGGLPAVLIAAFIIKSLPLVAVRWMVVLERWFMPPPRCWGQR